MTATRAAAQPRPHTAQHVDRFVRVLLGFEASLYSALTPMLPHYAHTLSVSKSAIGVLAAAYPAGMMGGALVGRLIASAGGLRRTMTLALIAFACASAAFGFASGIELLGALRFVEGTACGCLWGSGLAWLVSTSPPDGRGKAIGSALSVAVVGTLVGPVIGTLALALGTQLIFCSVAAVAVGLALQMRRYAGAPETEASEPTRWRSVGRDPRFLLGLWLVMLDATAYGAFGTLLPLRLAKLGASSAVIGGAFLLASVLSVVVARSAGRMADKAGPRKPLAIGLGLSVVLVVMLVLPATASLLILLTVLTVGGSLTMYMVPSMTYLTYAVETLGIALMTGTMILNFAWSAGETIGAPAAASLSQVAGQAVPLLALAALMSMTLLAVRRMHPPAEAPVGSEIETPTRDTEPRTQDKHRRRQLLRNRGALESGGSEAAAGVAPSLPRSVRKTYVGTSEPRGRTSPQTKSSLGDSPKRRSSRGQDCPRESGK